MAGAGSEALTKRLRNELRGVDSISHLFWLSFRRATLGLAADDVAALLRLRPGDLGGLGWLPTPITTALRAFFTDLAARDVGRRHRFRDPERHRLIDLLSRSTASEARTLFVLAHLIDEEFASRTEQGDLKHPGIALVPERFLGEIDNVPPPIGQMTPMAACRRWMRTFWFVGESRHLEAFGATPTPKPCQIPSLLRQRLQSACADDELVMALVAYRRHATPGDLVSGNARPGCFAISGLKKARAPDLMRRVVDELFRQRVHVALLPEISIDAAEHEELRGVLAQDPRRFPCLVVAGVTHQRTGDGYRNDAVALDSAGREVLRHEKLEPYRAGDQLEDIVPRVSSTYAYLDTPIGRLVVNICRDVRSDIPMFLNRLLGVSVLLVPAYSKRLDFATEEATLLGARQSCITLTVNPPAHGLDDAWAAYLPVRSLKTALWGAKQEAVPNGDAVVQVLRLDRAGGTGSVRADEPVFL